MIRSLLRKRPRQPENLLLNDARLWTLRLTCFAHGVPFCINLLASFVSTTTGAGFFLLFVSLLVVAGYLIVGLTCLGIGIWQASQGRWRAVTPCTVVPIVIVLLVFLPGTYKKFGDAADYVHFAVFSRQYEKAVNAAPQTEVPRMLWFFWTDASPPLAGQILIFLVFDESDGFALPNFQRSAAWKARYMSGLSAVGFAGGRQLPDDPPHHLIGHYYVVTIHS